MIPLFVFYIHLVGFILGFSVQYKNNNFRSALISLFFFILIFTVGWSIVGTITRLFINKEGFGFYLDQNGIILLLLTIIEFFFYKFYFKKN